MFQNSADVMIRLLRKEARRIWQLAGIGEKKAQGAGRRAQGVIGSVLFYFHENVL